MGSTRTSRYLLSYCTLERNKKRDAKQALWLDEARFFFLTACELGWETSLYLGLSPTCMV
eukprot:SAG11_NODE_38390_length_252_cov_1.045752_1_plen_59_part_01